MRTRSPNESVDVRYCAWVPRRHSPKVQRNAFVGLPARELGGLEMRIVAALLSSAIVCGLLAIRMATAADGPPVWAYPLNNPDYKPPVDDGRPVRVPDSVAGYTWSQLRDRFIAPVWHPSDHAALPDIVAQGRKPGVFACGFCHRAAGPGGAVTKSACEHTGFAALRNDVRQRGMVAGVPDRRNETIAQLAPGVTGHAVRNPNWPSVIDGRLVVWVV